MSAEVCVWRLDSDADRDAYARLRWGKPSRKALLAVAFGLFVFALALALRGTVAVVFPAVTSVLFAFTAFQYRLERTHAVESVELELDEKHLRITEVRPRALGMRRVGVCARQAVLLKSMRWLGAGCLVAGRELLPHEKPVVVPMGFFQMEENILAFERWAARLGLTIEGQRPLPGGYVRSVE